MLTASSRLSRAFLTGLSCTMMASLLPDASALLRCLAGCFVRCWGAGCCSAVGVLAAGASANCASAASTAAELVRRVHQLTLDVLKPAWERCAGLQHRMNCPEQLGDTSSAAACHIPMHAQLSAGSHLNGPTVSYFSPAGGFLQPAPPVRWAKVDRICTVLGSRREACGLPFNCTAKAKMY